MKIAAFFDFDNTLLQGDSEALEILDQLGRQWMSPLFLTRVFLDSILFKMGRRSSEQIVTTCLTQYRGLRPSSLNLSSERLFRRTVQPRLRPDVLSRWEDHRAVKHLLVLLSASPTHLVEPVARFLNADLWRTTRLETDGDGRFTGRADGPILFGPHKLAVARAMAADHGIDLTASYAYSDHVADAPFLEAIGHPIAVHPEPGLAAIARARGWPIVE